MTTTRLHRHDAFISEPYVILPGVALPERLSVAQHALAAHLPSKGHTSFAETTANEMRSSVRSSQGMSFATILAVICAKAAMPALNDVSSENVGVFFASSGGVLSVAHSYEMRGLEEGWQLIDPYQLPHSIASSLGASVAIATGCKGGANTFIDGHVSGAMALHRAISMLMLDIIPGALVGAAEEVGNFNSLALARCEWTDFFGQTDEKSSATEAAATLYLSRSAGEGRIRVTDCVNANLADGADVTELRELLGEARCDMVFSGNKSCHIDADVIQSLFSPLDPRFIGNSVGDTYGASFLLSVADAFKTPGWNSAFVFSASRSGSICGCLLRKV